MAKAQILVVEDEAIVAKNIQNELQGMGYHVPVVAHSGEEALREATETRPDLVLMDIVLKGDKNGVEVTEEILDRMDVPVVYLTAYGDDATLRNAITTEPYGYLIKPYEERELKTTIELALFKHRMDGMTKRFRRWHAAALRSVGDGLIVADAWGETRMVNPAAQTLTGWTEEEAFGKPLADILRLTGGPSQDLAADLITRAIRDNKAIGLEGCALTSKQNGPSIPIDGSLAPIHGGGKSLMGVVVVFRKRAENPTKNGSN